MNLNEKTCDNEECSERFTVRPPEDADPHYRLVKPDDDSILSASRFCSARCVARAMGSAEGISHVSVYEDD